MYCIKCGHDIALEQKFCGSCGTATSQDIKSHAEAPSPPQEKRDISGGFFAISVVGLFIVAWITYPIPSELQNPMAALYLTIRVGVPASVAAILVALIYLFRRNREKVKLKIRFTIACWIFLGLMIFGELVGETSPQQVGPQIPTVSLTYDSEGWTQESTGSKEVGPWLHYSPPGARYYRDATGTIYRLYPPGVRPDAEKANPFGLGGSTEHVPQ